MSIEIADLPHLHAIINAVVAVCLILGLFAIRSGKILLHRLLMVSALLLSAAFLVSYVVYHLKHGATKFTGQGFIRSLYFGVLISHTVLAVINLPLVFVTVLRALRGEFQKHRRIARFTFVIWLYVAITGPVVYLLLYQMFPNRGPQVFAEAQALHQSGKDKEALGLYKEAGDRYGHAASKCYAAVLDARLVETGSAALAIETVVAEQGADPHCSLLKGRELVYQGKLAEARSILERAGEQLPNSGLAQASLAFVLFRQQEYGEAAKGFARALAIDSKRGAYAFNLAYAHFLDGKYKKAEAMYERALSLGLDEEMKGRATEGLSVIRGGTWLCPMHPHVLGKKGETCTECKMDLEPVSAGVQDTED